MKYEFKMKIGEVEFKFSEEAKSHQEFFEQASFFSSLPKVGPNGETDLALEFRQTKEGHKYYSIVSKKAGMEFKLGMSLKSPGTLFGKGWEEAYSFDGQSSNNSSKASAPTQGLGAPTQGLGSPSSSKVSSPAVPQELVENVASDAASILNEFIGG